MSLMAWAISMACSSNTSVDQNACNKFLEASAKSTQVYQNEEKTENYFRVMATDKADNYFGKDVEKVGGGAYFGYKVYRDKAVDFKLPNMGLCDTLSNRVTPNSYSINIKWNFPWLK